MIFWGEKFPFSRQKCLMTFCFLVIDQIFQIFPFLSQIFPIFAMLNGIFDPFLTRKTTFFTLFILSRASDNTISLNIGGTNVWAFPTSNFGGTVPPVPPRSPPLFTGHVGPSLVRMQWCIIGVCGFTRPAGLPDPTRTRGYGYGLGTHLAGRVGDGEGPHGYGHTRVYPYKSEVLELQCHQYIDL